MVALLAPPSFRDRGGYAMACGIVRSLEKRLLDDDRLGELLDAGDDGAVMSLLKRWGWIAGGQAGGDASLPAAVAASLVSSDRQVAALDVESPCTSLFLLRFEMHNLAAAIKAGSGGGPLAALHPRGTSDRESLERVAAEGDFSQYPGPLAARLGDQWDALGGAPAAGRAVFPAWHEALLEAAREEQSSLLIDYLRHRTDLNNIKNAVRHLRHRRLWPAGEFLPGGLIRRVDLAAAAGTDELDRLLERTVYGPLFSRCRTDGGEIRSRLLEQEADDFLTAVMQPAKHVSLGPEALWGYAHGREVDADNIRAISMRHVAGREDGALLRLRMSYV